MRIFLCLVFVFSFLQSWGHGSNEIVYQFEGDSLTIHLTPQGALDLINVIRPGSGKIESIEGFDFTEQYEKYFNENIEINNEGTLLELRYVSSVLNQHDSYLRYRILDFDQNYQFIKIHISAFKDVYSNVQNQIVRPDGWMNDETGFQVLKEKFIEYDNTPLGFLKYYAFLLFPLGILGLLIFLIWHFMKIVIKIFRYYSRGRS